MRPEQKVIISTRQTGECAERLLEWLAQSRPLLKSQARGLEIEVHGISNELLGIVEAVEQRPAVGVVGSWGTARSELLGSLISAVETSNAGDEVRPALSRDRIMSSVPRDDEGGLAASLRLVAAERAEAPYRYPIRISLFSQLDVVKIIAAAYLVHVPQKRQRFATSEEIAETLTSKDQEILPQTFTGMSRRDIDLLRETLRAAAPESPILRRYDAVGYWDTLGALIPHLPETERRKAFTLLWGEDRELTALFERLSDGLEQIGFSGEAYAGLDALFGRDQITGWMVRHAESLVASATITACSDRPDAQIRTSSRHGRGVDIERFLLAALVDECSLPVATANFPLLETADMLVLPTPRPIALWPIAGNGTSRPPTTIGPLSAAEALDIFIAQKAIYQTDVAMRRHRLTSLVVASDLVEGKYSSKIDAATNALVADWIESTQGETAHARERRRTGLSILIAEVPESEPTVEPILAGTDGVNPRLAATIASVLDDNGEWAQEWTPNRPFRNVFSWRPPRTEPELGTDRPPRSADILRFERSKAMETSPQPATLALSHDLANLQHAIIQATTSAIHAQQLTARLTELRRTLTGRFLRLHMANDPATIVEWRRQVCHVARNRLQRAALTGTFGRLQSALMFTQGEVAAVLARLKSENPRRPVGGKTDLRTLEPTLIVEACFEAWIVAMRQNARVPSFTRAVQVPGPVVGHIVDELVLGAVRIGLQEKLSEAVRRVQISTERAVDCERSVAALLERGICAYVETLDPAARSLRAAPFRDTRFGMGTAATPRPRTDTERATLPAASSIAEEWAERFADMIEANILGAGLLGGTGHLNRELGQVLNAMSSNPFEGAQ